MKNKKIGMVMLCGMILLGGCGNAGVSGNEQENPAQPEEIRQDSDEQAENGGNQGDVDGSSAEIPKPGEEAGDGEVVIKVGPDQAIYESGSMVYTLHDFKLYESPEDASIDPKELQMADAEDYADRSKFLMVQVDIYNIDYEGYNGDEEMNLSTFTVAPKELDDSMQWGGSLPVYLSESGEEQEYYHMKTKPGETKSVAIGFYVPVKDVGELCAKCVISISGCMDEGYVFEIPQFR